MWLVPGFQGVAQHPIFCNKACQLIWEVLSLTPFSLFSLSLCPFLFVNVAHMCHDVCVEVRGQPQLSVLALCLI